MGISLSGDACSTQQTAATKLIYNIPFKIPGSQSDRQLFHYFCVRASSELSGYSTSNFWNRQLLQYSHHEPLVRRALIALSSIHQEYVLKGTLGSRDDEMNALTLLEYNKAVRQLRKYLASTNIPSKQVILTYCILFYCFEGARGEYGAAMEHLGAGLDILQNWVEEKGISYSPVDTNSEEDVGDLMQIFARMDLQASIFDDTRLPYLSLVSPEEKNGEFSCVPPEFKTLSEAQVTLDRLKNWLFHFLVSNTKYKFAPPEGIPAAVLREKRGLEKQLRQFSVVVDEFAESGRSKSSSAGTKVLVILHRSLNVLLQSYLPTNKAVPNDFDTDFEEILRLEESVLHSENLDGDRSRRNFSLETGLIAPLYLLIAKCRDPLLRRRALSLLTSSPRREGLIDGDMVVSIAERLMKFEENENCPMGTACCGGRSLEECAGALEVLNTASSLKDLSKIFDIRDFPSIACSGGH